MPRQLDSISSRSDSRHAFSCGESTSTPSTSKIAPWNVVICGLLSVEGGRPGCRLLAELEYGLLARAQLTDIAAGSDPDRTACAFGVDGQRQAIAGERHLDRGFPELHRERQAIELARLPRIEVQNTVADEGARVTTLHEVERP